MTTTYDNQTEGWLCNEKYNTSQPDTSLDTSSITAYEASALFIPVGLLTSREVFITSLVSFQFLRIQQCQ